MRVLIVLRRGDKVGQAIVAYTLTSCFIGAYWNPVVAFRPLAARPHVSNLLLAVGEGPSAVCQPHYINRRRLRSLASVRSRMGR